MPEKLEFTVAQGQAGPTFWAKTPAGEFAGEITSSRTGDIFSLNHTGVDPAHQGQGVAGQLAQFAFEHIEKAGGRVRPTCSYISDTFLPKHPEWQHLAV